MTDKSELTVDAIWKIIESNFKSKPNFFTINQLDSYNTFIKNEIPKTLRQHNPYVLVHENLQTINKTNYDYGC